MGWFEAFCSYMFMCCKGSKVLDDVDPREKWERTKMAKKLENFSRTPGGVAFSLKVADMMRRGTPRPLSRAFTPMALARSCESRGATLEEAAERRDAILRERTERIRLENELKREAFLEKRANDDKLFRRMAAEKMGAKTMACSENLRRLAESRLAKRPDSARSDVSMGALSSVSYDAGYDGGEPIRCNTVLSIVDLE